MAAFFCVDSQLRGLRHVGGDVFTDASSEESVKLGAASGRILPLFQGEFGPFW